MNTIFVTSSLLVMTFAAGPAVAACDPAPLIGVCLGRVTAQEGHFGEGTCEHGSSFDYTWIQYAHSHGVTVEVLGASDCRGVPGEYAYRNEGVLVYASAAPGNGIPGTVVSAYHAHSTYDAADGTSSTCQTGAAATGTGPRTFGCPAGPLPNPGWGQLLP